MENKAEKICTECDLSKCIDEFRLTRAKCRPCEKEIRAKKYLEIKDDFNEQRRLERANKKPYKGIPGITSICVHCDGEKPIAEFPNNNKSQCRECNKAVAKIHHAKKYQKFKKEYNDRHTAYIKKRGIEDPSFRIQRNIRGRLSSFFKGKSGKFKYVECSLKYLIEWLKYNFDENMTMANYGTYWHVDHVKPCSSFNFDNEQEIYNCFSWKNLRPLKGDDNIAKGDKIIQDDIDKQKKQVEKFLLINTDPQSTTFEK